MPSLRKICGLVHRSGIPSESTFSRALAEFATSGLGDIVHKAPGKRGRPENRRDTGTGEEKRLLIQISRTPASCDIGSKKNSKGCKETWTDYKLHIDTACNGLPLTAVPTSASLHDSRVAIPMMKLTAQITTSFYDLMDSAYDAKPLYQVSRSSGHVPVIDKNPRKHGTLPFLPAEEARYKERTVAEHTNGRLKEAFGGSNVEVRGYIKVKLNLMSGIIALFADQLLKLAR